MLSSLLSFPVVVAIVVTIVFFFITIVIVLNGLMCWKAFALVVVYSTSITSITSTDRSFLSLLRDVVECCVLRCMFCLRCSYAATYQKNEANFVAYAVSTLQMYHLLKHLRCMQRWGLVLKKLFQVRFHRDYNRHMLTIWYIYYSNFLYSVPISADIKFKPLMLYSPTRMCLLHCFPS